MEKKKLEKLINKTKQEILVDFGFEFNHYPSNEWTYTIKTNRLGIRTTLTFYFQNDKVVKVISKKKLLSGKIII